MRTNACNAITDHNACKSGAILKSIISNACNAVRDYKFTGKVGATIEHPTSNAGNAVGYIVIRNTLGDYQTARRLVTTTHLHSVCYVIGNTVIDTIDLKVVGTCDRCHQQQQRREQIS